MRRRGLTLAHRPLPPLSLPPQIAIPARPPLDHSPSQAPLTPSRSPLEASRRGRYAQLPLETAMLLEASESVLAFGDHPGPPTFSQTSSRFKHWRLPVAGLGAGARAGRLLRGGVDASPLMDEGVGTFDVNHPDESGGVFMVRGRGGRGRGGQHQGTVRSFPLPPPNS